MEESVVLMETLYEKVKEYSSTKVELVKLKALDKSARVVSSLVSRLIIAFFIFMFILVLNVAVSLWIGELLGKSYYGFFIVSFFYCIVGLILHFFFLKKMKNRIGNSFIEQMLN